MTYDLFMIYFYLCDFHTLISHNKESNFKDELFLLHFLISNLQARNP